MKKSLIKYYSKINLVILPISLILVIITDFFSFEGKWNSIFMFTLVISFLFSEILDLITSENSISLIILYLNKYSKIITPILLILNIVFFAIFIFLNFLPQQYIDLLTNISFIYSFLLPIIRILYDPEYISKITNGRLQRRR